MSSGAVASDAARQLVARPPLHPASFESFRPESRFDEIFLYYENEPEFFRYRLTVVDCSLPAAQIAYVCAVFLVPSGREAEYMFRSRNGLLQIAKSAQTARLICVSFGRRHEFASEESVRQELTFCVQVLSRQGSFLSKTHPNIEQQTNIPFLAMDGIGKRNVLTEGVSKLSGPFVVEQVQADDRTVRRLYFLDNPFVIQSEVALIPDSDKIDKSYAAFEYHKHMAAGILALTSDSTASSDKTGLMVGLGGGGLVNFLHYLLSEEHPLTAVELDPTVAQVAKDVFGIAVSDDGQSKGVTLRIGDGLKLCAETDEEKAEEPDAIVLPAESLDFLVIDVDSKDKSVGMSCPPQAFVTIEYLTQTSKLLKPDGLLVVNVSARDPSMLQLVCRNIQQVFPTVFLSLQNQDDEDDKEKEDVNVVLFAFRRQTDLLSQEDLMERLDLSLSGNETIDKEVIAEMKDCLEDITVWTPDSGTKNKSKPAKRKPKRGKKGKKRK